MVHIIAVTRERDRPSVVLLPSVLGSPDWRTRRLAVALVARQQLGDGSADDAGQLLACCWRRVGLMLGKTLPARCLLTLPEGWQVAETVDVSSGLVVDGQTVTRASVDPVFYALATSASALPTQRG